MGVLTPLVDAGLQAAVSENGKLKIYGDTHAMGKARAEKLYIYIQQNKQPIIAALSQTGAPGQCESCPAAGYWDYAQYAGQGMLCFHYAYYIGKTGKPKPCAEMRTACPRI